MYYEFMKTLIKYTQFQQKNKIYDMQLMEQSLIYVHGYRYTCISNETQM